jgi:YegS/Rv2252/BmrU family lipid kinase
VEDILSQISVILNGGAGNGHDDAAAADLRAKFEAAGLDAHITLAKGGDDMIEAARAALAKGARMVVAGGGDGTINAVASVLAGSGVPFGVLPLGTLNHFAKDLGIPLALDEAVRNLATGRPRLVDVGEVNDRIFLNNSSLGLYPDIVLDRERQERRLGRGKWAALAAASLHAVRRYPVLSLQLEVEGKLLERRSAFVFIGNNEYRMEGFEIGGRASLTDGRLSLYVTQRTGRFGLLRLALSALFGRLRQAADFDSLAAQALVVHTPQKHIRVATDGEVSLMRTPLHYRVRPAALTVAVPRK